MIDLEFKKISPVKMADQGSVLWSFEKVNNEWEPKFQQPISAEGKQKLQELITKLEEHEDVQKVITNIWKSSVLIPALPASAMAS